MILTTALLCLAANVYHEARGEVVMGRYAVASVTMNRAGGDPDKVCEVVAAHKQFSWTNKEFGLAKKTNGKLTLTAKGFPKDADAWDAAKKIAAVKLSGRMLDFTQGAKFYHTKTIRVYWAKNMTRVATIGNHRFYRSHA